MHGLYISYLLRIWESDNREQQLFLASLEKPGTRELINFCDLDELFDFLEKQIQLKRTENANDKNT